MEKIECPTLGKKNGSKIALTLIVFFLAVSIIVFVNGEPVGPRLIYNKTEEPGTSTSPLMLNHTKASITTLRLNVTQPNKDWKGYVGNVTGKLTLDDAENYTIYDWTFTTAQGEIYASRGSNIDWSSIVCANLTHVATEDSALNHATDEPDKINDTFKNTTHPEFYVGDTKFTTNKCNYTLYTYVNDSPSNQFPEILLYDETNSNLIYTAIVLDSTLGYDNSHYDFQMIVAEDSSTTSNIAYYFYVEVE